VSVSSGLQDADTGPLEVLLVEDDDGDAVLIREAMAEVGDGVRLHVVRDGAAALDFLRRDGAYAHAPQVGLVVLDLNLPGRDGRQVLAEIKADDELRAVPVVVLSSSQSDTDVVTSYQFHANAYVTKPLQAAAFSAAVREIAVFFSDIVKLPGGSEHVPSARPMHPGP
jgi:CheY-like chemotaxis protein